MHPNSFGGVPNSTVYVVRRHYLERLRVLRVVGVMGMLSLLVSLPQVGAEEPPSLTDDEVVLRTEGPYRLLLPKDWPVEQRANQYAPVPVEEYLSLKFGQVREALNAISQQLETMERRITQLEEDNTVLQQRLRRLEEAPIPQLPPTSP